MDARARREQMRRDCKTKGWGFLDLEQAVSTAGWGLRNGRQTDPYWFLTGVTAFLVRQSTGAGSAMLRVTVRDELRDDDDGGRVPRYVFRHSANLYVRGVRGQRGDRRPDAPAK